MSNLTYPYRSRRYTRTEFWWTRPDGSAGDWKLLSDWCNATCGEGNWEYYNNQFVFEKEADLTTFLLRWA